MAHVYFPEEPKRWEAPWEDTVQGVYKEHGVINDRPVFRKVSGFGVPTAFAIAADFKERMYFHNGTAIEDILCLCFFCGFQN
eukprot:4955517-Karenia_brevis.AAC.1